MKSASKQGKDKGGGEAATGKLNRVVELGRERKFVRGGEGDSFGPDPTSVEEINSVISMLGDGEGEIAVEAAEDSPFNADAEEEKEEEWVPDVPEEKEEQEDRLASPRLLRPGPHVPPGDGRRRPALARGRGRHRQGASRPASSRCARPSSRFRSRCSTC